MSTEETRAPPHVASINHIHQLNHAVHVSHVVWVHVVPVWLRYHPTYESSASWLVGVGEALWPLVALACRAVVGLRTRVPKHSSRLEMAAAAGAKSCVRWFLRNRQRSGPATSNWRSGPGGGDEKDLATAVMGLCAGGHLELAKALVGDGKLREDERGSGSSRWWRDECGLVWPDDDSDIVELIKSRTGGTSLLYRVFQGGHIEMAKWVVERFRITELWEAVEPLLGALSHGNLGVAQWLYDEFPGCGELMQRVGVDATGEMLHSVEVLEWAMERFPRCFIFENPKFLKYLIPLACEKAGHDDREAVRLCKWLKEKFSLKEVDIRYLHNITVLKWAVSAFNIELTTETLLSSSSRFNPDFIQWAVIEKNVSLTAELVIEMCERESCTVSHVKWFFERAPPLTREQLQKSLLGALECNNLEVAVWLDDSFHLMEEISADRKSLVPSFLELRNRSIHGTTGTKWFLQHISSLQMIPESSVVKVIKESPYCELISLLLETFHLNLKCIWKERDLKKPLREAVWAGIPNIKLLISWLGEDVLTKEYITQFLTNEETHQWARLSSKIVKWFIVHYTLENEQVKANDNLVLFRLISNHHSHCADWLIHRFGVTFTEVVTMMNRWKRSCSFTGDLRTWQLLLRNFPSLTPDVVRDHLMLLALSSPATAKFVLRTFPTITKADMTDYALNCAHGFSNETRLWLDVPRLRRF